MKTPFFITGLPRSRTAWMAAWLSSGDTLCFHDERFESDADFAKQRGFSGSELLAQYAEITLLFPESKWVFVLRDKAQCLESFKRVAASKLPENYDVAGFFDTREKLLQKKIGTTKNALVVFFSELGKEATGRRVWEFLFPDQPFDLQRWQVFNRMNIQQIIN